MKFKIIPHQLKFKFRAGTSRGFYTTHNVWYFVLEKDGMRGIGEIAPLKDLSIDAVTELENVIKEKIELLKQIEFPSNFDEIGKLLDELDLQKYPAIRFGFETAFLDFINGGERAIFDNSFSKSQKKIDINGLIWMGDKEFMLQQVKDKIEKGFSCIKMKIGAIDFNKELEILEYIRNHYSSNQIELRVDANGAFDPEDASTKLKQLSQYDLHSIEQPIKPKQFEEMEKLCIESSIPIALDEELIGIDNIVDKRKLLEKIRPDYIILKPTLVGGLQKSKEWIEIAESLDIDWWMTSALESNIGLNAISQFTAEYDNNLPQGLGTGSLYENNIASPLTVENGKIFYDSTKKWVINF